MVEGEGGGSAVVGEIAKSDMFEQFAIVPGAPSDGGIPGSMRGAPGLVVAARSPRRSGRRATRAPGPDLAATLR